MVLNVVGSNPIGHPRKSLATFRCEGFFVWYWLYYARPSIAMKQRRRSYSFNTAEKLNTLLLRMIRRMGLIKGSSIKCVDVFRIALKEEAMLCVKQKDSQDGQLPTLLSSSDAENIFILIL